MKNICIESQLLNHHQRSGLMTYTEGLINGMKQNDHENQYKLIYYSLRRNAEAMPGPSNGNFQKFVLRVPDREVAGRRWLIDTVALPGFFKKNKIGIFHRPSGYTMPDCKDVFKVLTVHDLRTLTIGDQYFTQNVDNYRKALSIVDTCVVVSECTKRDLMEHMKVDEKKIQVTYLGADERFRPASAAQIQAIKEKYNLVDPFLLSVGSVPRKNIDRIVQAFGASKYKDKFLLVLCCHLQADKYREMAKELGMRQRIRVLPKIEDSDLVALYSSCHCFVFPSLYEGFGLPIAEAMQCGAPVITSNMSSCPEVAGDAGILVDPTQVGQITDAINQICENGNLRQQLIKKGFEQVKLFSWNKFAEDMKRVYAKA
jgi:glycosyltransferase involved in cell wall biosynthesis